MAMNFFSSTEGHDLLEAVESRTQKLNEKTYYALADYNTQVRTCSFEYFREYAQRLYKLLDVYRREQEMDDLHSVNNLIIDLKTKCPKYWEALMKDRPVPTSLPGAGAA